MGLQYSKNSSRINMPPLLTTKVSPKKRSRRQRQRQRPLRRLQKKPKKRSAFKCPDQRVKSKTSWCFYQLYNKKTSDYLKKTREKTQIHSILKNLLPSTIFNHVQMTKPPDLLEQ